jgi:hypothetical protein
LAQLTKGAGTNRTCLLFARILSFAVTLLSVTPRSRTALQIAAFCLALAAAFFFGFRASTMARRIRRQNEPVRAWMSIPFIAHTHHVSEETLYQTIHIPPNPKDRRTVREIAHEQRVPPSQLVHELQDAVDHANGKMPDKAHP